MSTSANPFAVWLQVSFFIYRFSLRIMLDYVKMILLKVSFNRALFEKELRKSLRMLLPTEVPDFRTWCYQQFARIYRKVLKRVFSELTLQNNAEPAL